ncbi:hypothetical protein GCM10010255_48650 [Streptomyces coeruleofuscus]|uniref:Uncharacterized protein n=1 Tax=Streptomyces coeruleofuscus TaxID=66879 RepID=A0ABN3IM70_9ACTN
MEFPVPYVDGQPFGDGFRVPGTDATALGVPPATLLLPLALATAADRRGC